MSGERGVTPRFAKHGRRENDAMRSAALPKTNARPAEIFSAGRLTLDLRALSVII